MNTETVTTLQDNLRKMFDTIDREKLEALQAPNTNHDHSACYAAFREALAKLEKAQS